MNCDMEEKMDFTPGAYSPNCCQATRASAARLLVHKFLAMLLWQLATALVPVACWSLLVPAGALPWLVMRAGVLIA
ncbi:unnamed protein product [Boreogadus saida]